MGDNEHADGPEKSGLRRFSAKSGEDRGGLSATPTTGAETCYLRLSAALFVSLMILAGVHSVAAQEPSASRIEQAEKEPQNWLTFYGNYAGWSYSPLDQITTKNVKQLLPAWAFAAGYPPSTTSLRPGLEAAPLVLDGVLYLVGPQNNVYAIDAAAGKLVWQYVYDWSSKEPTPGNKGARGLAMGDGRIYMGTQDDHMVALDAKTGGEVWNVKTDDVYKCLCSITSPPLFVKGKVITGVAGGDGPFRAYIQAFDAATGKRLWHFDTVPAPGQPGSETWPGGDTWKVGGGATWLTGSYDPELHLVYWGTGNAFPDLMGEGRAGSNLYTASLLALDADTGKLKWFFQETPHDVYDFDSQPEPVLLDIDQGGRKRKVVLHSSKNGYGYMLDRETGKFLRAFPYVDTVTWTKGLDEDGKPIGAMIPGESKDFLFCPGGRGGRNFNHSAYSPRTGWWYTTAFEICSRMVHGTDLFEGDVLNPNSPPHIAAFDPLTGKKQWSYPTRYWNQSSLLSTAGDLIFAGDLAGDVFALDARTGQKLWSFSTGGRIASSPVSFSVNGRQYVAVSSGGGSSRENFVPNFWPEAKDHLPQPAATLFVFALPERSE
jgi:alcohol dehydrogenase (cytochrome c)